MIKPMELQDSMSDRYSMLQAFKNAMAERRSTKGNKAVTIDIIDLPVGAEVVIKKDTKNEKI